MAAYITEGKERIIVESCQYRDDGIASLTVFFIEPAVQQQALKLMKKPVKYSSKVSSGGSGNHGPSSGEPVSGDQRISCVCCFAALAISDH
jgi:hypothetical protein